MTLQNDSNDAKDEESDITSMSPLENSHANGFCTSYIDDKSLRVSCCPRETIGYCNDGDNNNTSTCSQQSFEQMQLNDSSLHYNENQLIHSQSMKSVTILSNTTSKRIPEENMFLSPQLLSENSLEELNHPESSQLDKVHVSDTSTPSGQLTRVGKYARSVPVDSNALINTIPSPHVEKIKSLEPSAGSIGNFQMTKETGVMLPRRPRSHSVPSLPNDTSCGSSPLESEIDETASTSPLTSLQIKPGSLRRGKWSQEEETYVARVIHDFNCGYLNAPAGTTLRTYLSDKLNCDPMRITKKFTGDSCIGKRVFHPAVRCASNGEAIDRAQAELDVLEIRWRKRLEAQHKESLKKAVAATTSRPNVPCIPNPLSCTQEPNRTDQSIEVTQAASWLDRTNAILSKENRVQDDFEREIQEVQRLIHEAPTIQKISAGLPKLLEGVLSSSSKGCDRASHSPAVRTTKTDDIELSMKRKVAIDRTLSSPGVKLASVKLPSPIVSTTKPASQTIRSSKSPHSSPPIQDEKRLKKSYSMGSLQKLSFSGIEQDAAEDAATLMGFLFSVREAAAASGKDR